MNLNLKLEFNLLQLMHAISLSNLSNNKWAIIFNNFSSDVN